MIHRIHDRIKLFRKEKGLSQENMANDLHISQGTYTNIENEVTSLSVKRLIEIAHLLDKDLVDFILSEENDIRKSQSLPNHDDDLVRELYLHNSELHDKVEHSYEQTIDTLNKQIDLLQKMMNQPDK